MQLSRETLARLDAFPGAAYVTGADDRLLYCGGQAWQRFATENGAPQLADPGYVIGTKLGNMISGEPAIEAHELIRNRLLSGARKEVVYEFSCPAPDERRLMRLKAAPFESDEDIAGIVYTSEALETSVWKRPISLLEHQLKPRTGVVPTRLLRMCSYCKSVETEPGKWAPVEAVTVTESEAASVGISHGICDICFSLVVTPLLREGPTTRP